MTARCELYRRVDEAGTMVRCARDARYEINPGRRWVALCAEDTADVRAWPGLVLLGVRDHR